MFNIRGRYCCCDVFFADNFAGSVTRRTHTHILPSTIAPDFTDILVLCYAPDAPRVISGGPLLVLKRSKHCSKHLSITIIMTSSAMSRIMQSERYPLCPNGLSRCMRITDVLQTRGNYSLVRQSGFRPSSYVAISFFGCCVIWSFRSVSIRWYLRRSIWSFGYSLSAELLSSACRSKSVPIKSVKTVHAHFTD